jgi:hypothetical protein
MKVEAAGGAEMTRRAATVEPRTTVVRAVLVIVGALNLLPGIGLLGPERLADLYGVTGLDDSVLVLLRHRALLLAMLGLFLVVAAFRADWRRPALIAALLSNVVFVLLTKAEPTTAEIARVATIDLIALPLLAVGLLLSPRYGRTPDDR